MKGSIVDAHAALIRELERIRDQHAPELHVYPLWRADMMLPAVWTWFGDGQLPQRRPNQCVVRFADLIVINITVNPYSAPAEDIYQLLPLVQLHREQLAPVLYGGAANEPGVLDGQTSAGFAPGQKFVQDVLGDARVTTAEMPIFVNLDVKFD